ncbi:uncharacterized protein LOC116724974 isoform X2 [Xiphophorus hellerii]|nr:uncharacterized protein LOC116724974 isoform X2 [Xiphophorus hellerii]
MDHRDPELTMKNEEEEELQSSSLATDVDQLFVVKTEDPDEWSCGLNYHSLEDDTKGELLSSPLPTDDLQVIKEEASNESDYRIKHQGPELYLKEEKEEVSASPLTADVQKVLVVKEEVPDEWSFSTTHRNPEPLNEHHP